MTDQYKDIVETIRDLDDRQLADVTAYVRAVSGSVTTDEEAAVLSALREGGTVHERCTRVVSAIVATAIGENLGDQSKNHGAAKLHAAKGE